MPRGSSFREIESSRSCARELVVDGIAIRYPTVHGVDGLPPGEGTFLPCTFWLADSLTITGRIAEADEVFERRIGACNDVGLLSEEYDPRTRRMMGNFPQALMLWRWSIRRGCCRCLRTGYCSAACTAIGRRPCAATNIRRRPL